MSNKIMCSGSGGAGSRSGQHLLRRGRDRRRSRRSAFTGRWRRSYCSWNRLRAGLGLDAARRQEHREGQDESSEAAPSLDIAAHVVASGSWTTNRAPPPGRSRDGDLAVLRGHQLGHERQAQSVPGGGPAPLCGSPRVKRSKLRSRSLAGTPGPAWSTSMTPLPSRRRTATRTRPRPCVCAWHTRFDTMRSSRRGSASMIKGGSSTTTGPHPSEAARDLAVGGDVQPGDATQTAHMIFAAFMVSGFLVATVYAAAILRGKKDMYHRRAFAIAFGFAALARPCDRDRRLRGALRRTRPAGQARHDGSGVPDRAGRGAADRRDRRGWRAELRHRDP